MLKVQYDSGKVVIIHYWNMCMFSYKFWVFLPIWQTKSIRGEKVSRSVHAKENRTTKKSQSKVVFCVMNWQQYTNYCHRLLFCLFFLLLFWLLLLLMLPLRVKSKWTRPESEQTKPCTQKPFSQTKLQPYPLFFRITQTWHIFHHAHTKLLFFGILKMKACVQEMGPGSGMDAAVKWDNNTRCHLNVNAANEWE